MRSLTWPDIKAAFFNELRAQKLLIGVMVSYCLLVLGLGFYSGNAVGFFLYSEYFAGMIVMIGVWFVYLRAAKLAGKTEKGEFFNRLKEDILERINLHQVVGAVLLFVLFSTYFSVFQSAKVMIPSVNSFSFDAQFAALDRQLHGGYYPHELVQYLLGSALGTQFIQFFYNIWFPIMLGVLAWQMFDRSNPELRQRFLVSYALSWFIIGTLGAIALSSAGPVYFDRATGLAGPYEDHMAFLYGVNEVSRLFTLDVQEILWTSYANNELKSGAGISAMPSMHVSVATLLFLFSRHLKPWATWFFGIFLLGIQLGSVHLGWHYAVDGYLGALLMALIWWGVGAVVKVNARNTTEAALKASLQTGR